MTKVFSDDKKLANENNNSDNNIIMDFQSLHIPDGIRSKQDLLIKSPYIYRIH